MAFSSERKSPGVFGVLFGASLSVAVGVILAAIHLASQPVTVMKTAPKEAPQDGKLYYVMGAPGSTAGKAWQAKQDSLAANGAGVISLTEAELNAWSEATFEQAKIADENKGRTVMILAGAPNFRFDGQELRIGLVNTVNFFGSESPLVLHARGSFAKDGSGWRFVPSEAHLGALPLHKIPALLSVLADRFGARQPPPVVDKVLHEAKDVAVRDGALVIAMH